MATSIYQKIDQGSVGQVDVEDYAAFVRAELARLYPDATIEIETTTRESGVMPRVIEAETAAEERDIALAMDDLWNRYCAQQER